MANYTISYSPKLSGWTSYHSFYPEWMVSMNNFLYTFNNGNLYKHNTNQTRNSYYGVVSPSKITTIFNQEPTQTKAFKTLALNSTSPWQSDITSDQGEGFIDSSWYDLKEGTWYAYIRRNVDDNNLAMISTQGVGNLTSIVGHVLSFSFGIGSILSTGDKVYAIVNGNLTFVGNVLSHTNTSITTDGAGPDPVAGTFIVFQKNAIAESYPTLGTYLKVEFINSDTSYTELFSVTSSIFKSYP
jgi:hypothetical protein